MQRILIAGAGYLGFALAESLFRSPLDYEVYLARRTPFDSEGFKTIACDFSEASSLRDLPEVDAIYYAVSADGATETAYERAYSLGVKNLIDHYKSRSIRPKFYFSSSTSVYAAKAGEIVTEDRSEVSSEGMSRFIVAGERSVLTSGFEGAVLRYGGIYGPDRTSFLRRVRDGLEVLTPNADHFMNRIHRDDAIGIVAFLLRLEDQGMKLINAVDLEPTKRDEVITWILSQSHTESAEYPKDFTQEPTRNHRRVLSAKLQALGYRYVYPSYKEGYKELLSQLGQSIKE